MPLTTLSLPHLPSDLRIHLALYTNLFNAQFLRSQLLAGNPDFEYAFIDATTILSPTHLYAAIFRASNDWMNKRIRSRNIHSEIVYCLGFTNNIATTLNTFGISDETNDLLVVKVSCPSLGLNQSVTTEGVEQHLRDNVEGEVMEFGEERLRDKSEVEKVKKIYKLGSGNQGAKARRRKDGGLEGDRSVQKGGDLKPKVEEEEEATAAAADEKEWKELEMQVLGLMALRGAV